MSQEDRDGTHSFLLLRSILLFFFLRWNETKRNEEEDKKKPLISLLCKRYSSVSLPLPLSASSAPTLYIYMHTHTHRTHTTKSLSFCQERKSGFVLGFRVSFTNSREKNAKKFCVCAFLFRVWAHPLPEKKKISSFLFFPAFLVLEKKIFSEMRCTQRSA